MVCRRESADSEKRRDALIRIGVKDRKILEPNEREALW